MKPTLKVLSPREEVAYMREVLGIREPAAMVDRVIDSFMVLQARSGLLLSLVTLCLTISGFSGHRIASAGPAAAVLLSLGLAISLFTAGLLLSGPLQLRWATGHACAEGFDATLEALLGLRARRTRRYHRAAGILMLGLLCYLAAVVLSLFPGVGAA